MISTRTATAVVIIGAAACGGRASTDTAQPLPRTSGPRVQWRDNAFVTDGFPAVARSGQIVVVALRENDAGRGFPNLRIEIRDRTDRATAAPAVAGAPAPSLPEQSTSTSAANAFDVLNSNEYETLAPAGEATAALHRRITAANVALDNLHAAYDLVAMTPLELQRASDNTDPNLAIGNGIAVQWRGDRLEVSRPPSANVVTSRDARPWLIPPQPSCAQCAPCENPAFLGAVYYAAPIRVVVAQIRYRGTDACWEPSDQFHVVAW